MARETEQERLLRAEALKQKALEEEEAARLQALVDQRDKTLISLQETKTVVKQVRSLQDKLNDATA